MNLLHALDSQPGRAFLAWGAPLHGLVVSCVAGGLYAADAGGCRSTLALSVAQALGCSRLRAAWLAWRATAANLRFAVDAARLLHTEGRPPSHRFEGLHHLETALGAGSGAVLAASFFGCFYYALLGPWPAGSALQGRRVNLVLPQRDERVLALCRRVRERGGLDIGIIEMGVPAAAVLLARALRGGDIVICMVDNVPDGAAVSVAEFFGRPACLPAGFLVLAERLGSPVLACGTHRHGTGFATWFDAPLHSQQAPEGEALGWLSQALAHQIEQRVRAHPGQWTSWNSVRQKWALAQALSETDSVPVPDPDPLPAPTAPVAATPAVA